MLNQTQGLANPVNHGPSQMMMLPHSTQSREDCVLFVGNLSQEVSDAVLHDFFAPIGNLNNVSVKKNFYTGEPRGFGFVNFTEPESARRAKLQLNHSKLMSREIRISFKKDFNKLDPEANLYIKNIDESVSGKTIETEFGKFGPIFCCAVKYDQHNSHLGYGYCQFEKKNNAEEALGELNGTVFGEKAIVVQKFLPKSKRKTTSWRTNLYVKNFPDDWNKEKIEAFITEKFAAFGKVCSQCVKFSEKFSSHFAFVAFDEASEATSCLKELEDFDLGEGAKLYVGYAQKKFARRKALSEEFARTANETNLFLKSLKAEVTKDEIKAIFEKYGTVTSIGLRTAKKLPKALEEKGVELQFGFINFADPEEAKIAFAEGKKDAEIRKLISEHHDPKKDFLYFAQPKAVREQFLRMQRKNIMSASLLQQQMMMMQMLFNQNMQNQRKMTKNMSKRGGQQQVPNMMMNPMNPMNSMNPAMFNMNMNMMLQQKRSMGQMNMQGQMPMGGNMGGNMGFNPMMNNQFQAMNQNSMMGMQSPAAPAQFSPSAQTPEPTSDLDSKDLAWLKNNTREFEQLSDDEKRKILGNLMYYRVANLNNIQKELVPKITGMLIDLEVLDLQDIFEILQLDEVLLERVNDAVSIINEADN